jgi:hypothetical protein
MAKQKMPLATIDKVRARSEGLCERCGTGDSLRWSFHHRKPRRMGGTRDLFSNSPANIVLLCGSGTEGCHGLIESRREESKENGLLLYANDDPLEVPVNLRYGLVFLDDGGGLQLC